MKITARQWKKLVLWTSAYVNIIVFALVGGYFVLKDDDANVKKSAKYAFVVTLAYTVFSILLNILSYVSHGLEWTSVQPIFSKINTIMNFSRFIVYPVMAFVDTFFLNKDKKQMDEEKEVEDGKEE